MDPRYNRPRLRAEEPALLRRQAGPLATFRPDSSVDPDDVLHADGTFRPVSGLPSGVAGDILYHDGADWVVLPIGAVGQVLTVAADSTLKWTDLPD